MEEEKGFWSSIFDFSFKSLAIPKLVPVLYIIVVVIIILIALFYVVIAFAHNIFLEILVLVVGAPIIFFLYTFSTRLCLETIMLIYLIREDLTKIKESKEKTEEHWQEE